MSFLARRAFSAKEEGGGMRREEEEEEEEERRLLSSGRYGTVKTGKEVIEGRPLLHRLLGF